MRVFLLILLKYLFPDVYIFLLILSIFFHIAIKKAFIPCRDSEQTLENKLAIVGLGFGEEEEALLLVLSSVLSLACVCIPRFAL